MNEDNYIVAVINFKYQMDREDASDEAQRWLEALAKALPVEAIDAAHAKEIYEVRKQLDDN